MQQLIPVPLQYQTWKSVKWLRRRCDLKMTSFQKKLVTGLKRQVKMRSEAEPKQKYFLVVNNNITHVYVLVYVYGLRNRPNRWFTVISYLEFRPFLFLHPISYYLIPYLHTTHHIILYHISHSCPVFFHPSTTNYNHNSQHNEKGIKRLFSWLHFIYM